MFLHPFGLLALAAVPAVVALHLYRRRYRPAPVSAVFLWRAEDQTPTAGRKREPLRRSGSFWCEVLAALALGLVFAGPRPAGASDARHLVLVLDPSASMGAIDADGGARARALEAAVTRLDRLPRGSRVTLIAARRRPEVLAGPAALPAEARAALAAFDPADAGADPGPALALALELAGGRAVTWITDREAPASTPPEVEVVAVGRPAANVGWVAASRRREAGSPGAGSSVKERASLLVANFSAVDATRSVELATASGVVVAMRSLELPPGAESHLSFELPEDAPLLVARLTSGAGADALAADDIAYLAPAPRRTLRLASTLSAEVAAALGVDSASAPSNIDRWVALVPDAVDTIQPALAHLVLAEALPPATTDAPSGPWTLAIAAPGEAREHFVGPFLADPAHPLLAGVTFEGVVWSATPDLALAGAPFVSAGPLPLATEVARGASRAWLLNLDPRRSTLQRSPDWPILLANAAEVRRASLPGPSATTLALGEPLRLRVSEPTTVRLRRTSGATVVAGTFTVQDTLELEGLDAAGSYALEALDAAGGATPLATLGVSLCDAAESDLRSRSTGVRAAAADEATVRAGFTWVELALLAAALGLVALDWWLLQRPSPAMSLGRARGGAA